MESSEWDERDGRSAAGGCRDTIDRAEKPAGITNRATEQMKLSLKPENLAQLVFVIRGEKVMLDVDLAKLYGVSTKALNQAFRRNKQRFPSDFAFQLSKEEFDQLRSQIVTSSPAIANLEVTNCDLKVTWRSPLSTLRFHRARGRHAFECAAQYSGGGSQYRDHAHLRTAPTLDGHQPRACSQGRSA